MNYTLFIIIHKNLNYCMNVFLVLYHVCRILLNCLKGVNEYTNQDARPCYLLCRGILALTKNNWLSNSLLILKWYSNYSGASDITYSFSLTLTTTKTDFHCKSRQYPFKALIYITINIFCLLISLTHYSSRRLIDFYMKAFHISLTKVGYKNLLTIRQI